MAERVTVAADDLLPYDMLNEGEVVRTVMLNMGPDSGSPPIRVEAGILRVEDIETNVPDFPVAKTPAWESLHEVWFDFGEKVTVFRGWLGDGSNWR